MSYSSRVEKYRETAVSTALDAIIKVLGHPLDTKEQIAGIKRALDQLYTNGAGWGEQDGASEATREATERFQDAMDSTRDRGLWNNY